MRSRFFRSSLVLLAAIVFSAGIFQTTLYATEHQPNASDSVDDGFGEEGFGKSEQGDDFGDEGFGDAEEAEIGEIKLDLSALKKVEFQEVSSLSFGGFLKEELGYSFSYEDSATSPYDKPDFSKLRTTANFYLDYKFPNDWKGKIVWNAYYDYAYTQRGRDKFSDEVLKSMESEFETRDLFMEGPLADWLRVKIGRQVIAWGESDTAQIVDMANPRDMREIGMVDLEDARIPVMATKFSALFGSFEIDLVTIHEFRANKIGARGSEFDFLSSLPGALAQPQFGGTLNDEETTGYNDTEVLFRLYKSFNGGDISLVWSDTYDDSFYLDSAPGSADLTPKHKRIQSIGAAGNKVFGSWLIKAEVGQKKGKAEALNQELMFTKLFMGKSKTSFSADDEIWLEKTILEGMIGADYSGISDVRITFEMTGERIQEYEDTLRSQEISGGYSLRITHSAMNDTVNSTLFWMHYFDDNGDVIRADVQYDVMEALQLTVGAINYLALETNTDATVYPVRNNDRLIMSAKYSY